MTRSNHPFWRRFAIAVVLVFGLFLALFGYYRFWFLRQPVRTSVMDETVFVSPANGRITAVVSWDSASLALHKGWGVIEVLTDDIGTRGTIISIEMDITHVHYQRAPVRSRFLRAVYRKGAFRNALIQKNKFGFRLENEHNALLFETAGGLRYKVVQIAGLLARRIEDYLEPGQQVQQGETIGLIKLGSQVTLVLPEGITPVASPGQVVVDGETIVAEIDDSLR
jgi:phosphatidylserine decarboxylase